MYINVYNIDICILIPWIYILILCSQTYSICDEKTHIMDEFKYSQTLMHHDIWVILQHI